MTKIREIGCVKHYTLKPDQLERLYRRLLNAQGPSIDTRVLQPGQVFFALNGTRTDGHNFLEAARSARAAFAVVEASRQLPPLGDFLEPVPDVLDTLQALAARHRRELKARVLGLTGSNGKTTTKDLLKAALSTRFHTFATPGNLNNHIGLPFTLLQVERDVECLILEMGDNRPGDIAQLCAIAQPTAGLITNIGQDHLAGYDGMAGNALTKLELFDYLNEHGGLVFRNCNDPWLAPYPAQQVVNYGIPGSSVWSDILDSQPGRLKVRLSTPTGSFEIENQLTGTYNSENLVAAASVALQWGVPVADLSRAFTSFAPSNQRSQLIEINGRQVIADCYNANPSSMRAALSSLKANDSKSLALILGEMLELGDQSETLHRELAPFVMALDPAIVIGVGKEMIALLEELGGLNCHYYSEVNTLAEDLQDLIRGCDLVFLKGSRSVYLERLIDELTQE